MPKKIFIPVAQHHFACLQSYQQKVESQLKDFHAALSVDKEKKQVWITPCQGSECMEDWQALCKSVVDKFIKSLKHESVDVPLDDKKLLMNPVIDKTIQNEPLLHIEYMKDRSIVFITGEQSDVVRIKKILEDFRESLINETFTVPLDKKDLMRPVIGKVIQDEQALHIEYMEDKSILSITGKQSDVARIKKMFEDFRESLINETFTVPLDKKDLMHPFIKEIQNKQLLRTEYIEDRSIIFITGERSEVTRVKKELEDFCETIVLKEKFPISDKRFFTLLNAVLKQILYKYPKIEVTIDKDDHSVTMTGFIDDCEQLKSELSKLSSSLQSVPVSLTDPFNQFVTTNTGRELLDIYAGNFIAKMATYYINETGQLFILGTNKSQTAMEALAHKIQNSLCCLSISFPITFQKSLLSSTWVDLTSRLKEKQLVQFSYAVKTIKIVGDSRMSKYAKEEIEDFIKNVGVAMRKFQLHYGKWRLIRMHLNEQWCRLECKLQKDDRVKLIVLGIHDEKPFITLEADVQIFKTVEKEIEGFLSVIVSSSTPIREKRQVVIDYFHSKAGKSAVEQIEKAEQSCIHITVEDDNKNVSNLVSKHDATIQHDDYFDHTDSALKCNMVCSAYSATGSVKINLYYGDITSLPVDVMVNATNLRLKHTRGVALAISKVGGACIQGDSDKAYQQSAGNIKEGDVIMTQEVGGLPCKSLIHVVSPTWQDGNQNESFVLMQACTKALEMASQFQSISFPAIGCGSYEFPIIVCARNMVEAVIAHCQENPSSSITEVSFVVLDQHEVIEFANKMNQLLANFTFTSEIQKALSVTSTSTKTSNFNYGASKPNYGGIVIEEKEGYVIITMKDQSIGSHSTSIDDSRFQTSTENISTENTASSSSNYAEDDRDQYIELLNGELLQYPVSYTTYVYVIYAKYIYVFAG